MKRYISVFLLTIVIILALSACGESTHVHTSGDWVVKTAASCTADGERIVRCTECGEILESSVIKAGHDFEITTVSPTCTGKGYDCYSCKNCDTISMDNFVDPLGHICDKFDAIERYATASVDGIVLGTCKRCNEHTKITLAGSSDSIARAFYGKKISIIGDSISTYVNISNGNAASNTNSTISKNSLYYFNTHNEALGVKPNDTWWMRTVNALGADLLVNNSDSGSYIRDPKSNGNPGGYKERAVNLHDNTGDDAGTKPDMVFVYLGTNDFGKYYNSFGDVSKIDFEHLEEKCAPDYSPATVAEAYAIMLYKIAREYEGVEIYCLNILDSTLWKSKSTYLPEFNAKLAEIAKRLGATVVDIYNESGIKNDADFEKYIPSNDGDDTPNTLHPNSAGFELIANVVLRAVEENSRYFPNIYGTDSN